MLHEKETRFTLIVNFAHKIINNANFLNLFAVNNLNRADIDFINQSIQNCFISLQDGRIFQDFFDEPSHIAVRAAWRYEDTP